MERITPLKDAPKSSVDRPKIFKKKESPQLARESHQEIPTERENSRGKVQREMDRRERKQEAKFGAGGEATGANRPESIASAARQHERTSTVPLFPPASILPADL